LKQILQNARSGELKLVDVPAPAPSPGQLLVQNHFSVVSPGTDKIVIDFARKSILGKARSRPDLVSQVLRKVRQEGPLPTYRTVVDRLDSPQPLGYSCAGVVQAVGEGVEGFAAGDRVACAGAGYANHAELVCVPENLAALVPDGLPLDRAAFATLGAIALQGIRIADPKLGEIAVVVGLGLIGQLTVQLLAANGCRVLGVDIDERRVKQALDLGAEWATSPESLASGWSNPAGSGYGVDFALVTASAESAAPIQLSAELCRQKGRVVVVGAMPLELDRRTFYDKELELRLSMSYGPGRYDRHYEEQGLDYPLPYVRWTENRNLQAFLALAQRGRVHPDQLDAETVPFEAAEGAYEQLAKGTRRSLAVIFRYAATPDVSRSLRVAPAAAVQSEGSRSGAIGVAFIGAGHYAKAVLLPALSQRRDVRKLSLVTATGPSAKRTAERFSFARCGTDPEEILRDQAVDLVFIATRHDLHASQAVAALRAGKAVWLEKPMGLDAEQVDAVAAAARETGCLLALGYNRRFSSHARAIKAAFAERQSPLAIQYTISTGPTPSGTWITDPNEGGGRIIGEHCHFVDLCTYLVGQHPTKVFAEALGRDPETDDSTISQLVYADGSCATIHYLTQANTQLPKERFEVSGGGVTAICDNFKRTRILGGRAARGVRRLNQDKGQATAIAEVVDALTQGRAGPFDLEELLSTSHATFALVESIRSGAPISLSPVRVRAD
jgi:predicted dehydrogenase/threonine dehydrogenase-like Zn-dependent dehydrogenase